MPVRITDIPDLQYTRLNQAEMDPRIAALPGKELGELADSIAGVSEPFAKLAGHIQAAENGKATVAGIERMSTLPERAQEHVKGLPPEKRVAEARKFVDKEGRKVLEDPKTPEAVKRSVRPAYQSAQDRTTSGVARDLSLQSATEARKEIETKTQNAISTGNQKLYDDIMDYREQNGLAAAGEREQGHKEITRVRGERDLEAAASTEPSKFLEEHVKPPEGSDQRAQAHYLRCKEMARYELNERGRQADRMYYDGVATGAITSEDDIDKKIPNASPGQRLLLKQRFTASLKLQSNATERASVKQEGNQNVIAAEVQDHISKFDFDAPDTGAAYLAIRNKVDLLDDNHPERARLLQRMDSLNHVRGSYIASKQERAFDEINTIFRTEIDKEERAAVSTMPVKRAIESGHLKDLRNITGYGMTKEDYDYIHAPVVTFRGSSPHSTAERPVTNEEQVARFNERYAAAQQRRIKATADGTTGALPPVTKDGFLLAAASAIENGRDTIEYRDPEQMDAAQTKVVAIREIQGSVQREFNHWLVDYPNEKDDVIKAKVAELTDKARMRMRAAATTTKAAADLANEPPRVDAEILKKEEAAFKATNITEAIRGFDSGMKDEDLEPYRKQVIEMAAQLGGPTFEPHQVDALASFQKDTGQLARLLVTKEGRKNPNDAKAPEPRSKEAIANALVLYRNPDGRRSASTERRRIVERRVFLGGYAKTPSA